MRSSWNCTNNFSIMKNGSNRNLQSMGINIQYFVLTRKSLKFCDKWILKWLGLSLPRALTKTRPWTLLLLQKYISSHMYWEDSPCFPHVLSNLSLLICQLLFDLLCCLIHDDPSEWSKAWTWFDVIDLSEQTGIVVLSTVVPTSFMGVDTKSGGVMSCHLIWLLSVKLGSWSCQLWYQHPSWVLTLWTKRDSGFLL
jgi:hypothetical protein